MLLMWIISGVLIAITILFAWLGSYNGDDIWQIPAFIVGLFATVFLIITIACTSLLNHATYTAKFLNATYHTSYTADDIYWNGNEIEQLIIGDKHRIEINKGE